MLALPAGDPGVSSSRLAPPQIRHRPRLDPPYPPPPSFCRSGDWRRRRSTGRRRVRATWLRRRRGPGPTMTTSSSSSSSGTAAPRTTRAVVGGHKDLDPPLLSPGIIWGQGTAEVLNVMFMIENFYRVKCSF